MMRRILAFVIAVFLVTIDARAQVADNMTCQQAVAYYEANGRISVVTSGATIPLYDGVPVSRRRDLRCPTTGVNVRTTDNRRCTVAYKCLPRSR